MNVGGRPKHNHWDGFTEIKDTKSKKAMCNKCLKVLSNVAAERLKTHKKLCEKSRSRSPLSNSSSSSQAGPLTQQLHSKSKSLSTASSTPSVTQSDPCLTTSSLSINLPSTSTASSATTGPVYMGDSESEDIDLIHGDDDDDNEDNQFQTLVQHTTDPVEDDPEADFYRGEIGECNEFDDPTNPKDYTMAISSRRFMKEKETLFKFVDKISKKEQKVLDLQLAKMFYGCNIPFAVVESTHFKEFLKRLRPAYVPPTRKRLGGPLLDEVYFNIKESITIGKHCVLVMDGWKNDSANSKNIAVMLQSGKNLCFLESWDLTAESETGDRLEEIVEESIQLAKATYGVDVHAVVTDNASNMKKMGRQTSLFFQTCNSHTANLLAKDLVSKPLIAQVNVVQKFFSRPENERKLILAGGKRTVLPSETRWCSNRDVLKNFLTNLPAMKQAAAVTETFDKEVTKKIFDQNLAKQVKDGITLMDPVCIIINVCQKNSSTIADAAQIWMTKEIPEGFESLQSKFSSRRKYALTEVALCANFLHPKYRGGKLTEAQQDKVEEFLLDELDEEGLCDLQKFKQNSSIFSKLTSKGISNSDVFWGTASRKHPKLADLAQKLLTIPASSAGIERLFSNWSFVHSKLRNKLGSEKSKKLVFIYHSLKMLDAQESAEY